MPGIQAIRAEHVESVLHWPIDFSITSCVTGLAMAKAVYHYPNNTLVSMEEYHTGAMLLTKRASGNVYCDLDPVSAEVTE